VLIIFRVVSPAEKSS